MQAGVDETIAKIKNLVDKSAADGAGWLTLAYHVHRHDPHMHVYNCQRVGLDCLFIPARQGPVIRRLLELGFTIDQTDETLTVRWD